LQRVRFGWGGGDPHVTSYDNLTYTFNGYGKFILSKAKDNSFEIQAKTAVIQNVNSGSSAASLVGTLFTGFAMQTNQSSIFEFELAGAVTSNPYLSNLNWVLLLRKIKVLKKFNIFF
jgi:hypothetical protein